MKQAMKESAPFQHEGIMSISRSLSGNVDAKVKKWVKSAKRQGQDIDKMSEQELKYLIELNKPKPPKIKELNLADHFKIGMTVAELTDYEKELVNELIKKTLSKSSTDN